MSYAFGDSDLAARRLRVVAEVFEPSTKAFLQRAAAGTYGQAVNLGCGPGCTTRLLAEELRCERVAGVDSSPHFISVAGEAVTERVSFCLHDFTAIPFPVGPSDLLFCRFVLTHQREVAQVMDRWASQLRPGGLLLMEETEWIETDHPVFAAYLAAVVAMLNNQANELYVGKVIHRLPDTRSLVRKASDVYRFPVDGRDAAVMFHMNILTWKRNAFIQANYASGKIESLERELEALSSGSGGEADIVWGLRQMVMQRTDEEGQA